MGWICTAAVFLLKGLFFFFWDGLKALTSPFRTFRRRKLRMDYGEEICLVTGAAQGLGRVLALELAKRHAVLVIWDVQEEKLQEVADDIKEMGCKVYPYVCDCSKRNEIYKVAKRVKKEVGPVSVLINNAGVNLSTQNILEADDDDIERTFQVNTFAHIWTVKAFLPWMLENNYGNIVQVASILAFMGTNKIASYCASKAAAVSFSETLRQELRNQKKTGVSVTCVCPGHMDTPMFFNITTSLPSLLPTLRSEVVAKRILRAMEEKQFLVCLPKIVYLYIVMISFLPTRTTDALRDTMGMHKALDKLLPPAKKTT